MYTNENKHAPFDDRGENFKACKISQLVWDSYEYFATSSEDLWSNVSEIPRDKRLPSSPRADQESSRDWFICLFAEALTGLSLSP
ncbi:hypothetical protein J6590_004613 [Homalodisca vitripennis]|nr:hypothetical protein J6590_004613 [Homalodisca vitripennis]